MYPAINTPQTDWSMSITKTEQAFFVIEPGRNTTYVYYNERQNQMSIRDNRFNERVLRLYRINMLIIKEHLDAHNKLNLSLSLRKVNTMSLKCLFDMFKGLSKYKNEGKKIKVTWSVRAW
ncbi:MAG: hypothetical protein ACJAVY_000409 [Marinoscillum sp.]|jgi:hypothetical protein